ncbi:GNAT family N-acetyltransferase [Streptomyces sp. ISL-10]|uniref:GNAT family N-acetyltransferase n=1 Tax=Streptomyces sp. ISL-10 TaxID=2819172 RepID=UPI001BE68AA6|nr:GNAT family N-acetyltransferase [Streptomyces sp. ISL-10]
MRDFVRRGRLPHVLLLAVGPDHQALGLGSALVDEVIERARVAGARKVQIALRRSSAENIARLRTGRRTG